ncbi:MAG: hypothetical protein JWP12_588 [Bacteroidetes bacterium]|nr:hypothetical protein [Bacteroidota bacterium]
MKLKAILIFSLIPIIQSAQTQYVDETANVPKKSIRVSEAALYPSFILQMEPTGTLEDFRKLAPGSTILSRDYSSYTQNRYNAINGDAVLSGNIGISFLNKKTNNYRNITLRIGVSYLTSGFSSSLSKNTTTRFDTLVSTGGGASAYVDSVRSQHVGMNYRSNDLRADLSIVFRTKPEARWGLYGGIGFTVGASINAFSDITYSDDTQLETTYGNTVTSSSYNNNSASYEPGSERHVHKNGMGYSAYLPIGLDYRMANKSEFWKRLHLFYEGKFFVNVSTIGDLGMVTSAGMQNGVGLRVTF